MPAAVPEGHTLYYRHDHPNGYAFHDDNPAPDPAEGWVASPADIKPAPFRTFECTTLTAYEELVRSEREAARGVREARDRYAAQAKAQAEEIEQLKGALRLASAQIQALTAGQGA